MRISSIWYIYKTLIQIIFFLVKLFLCFLCVKSVSCTDRSSRTKIPDYPAFMSSFSLVLSCFHTMYFLNTWRPLPPPFALVRSSSACTYLISVWRLNIGTFIASTFEHQLTDWKQNSADFLKHEQKCTLLTAIIYYILFDFWFRQILVLIIYNFHL